MPEYLFSYISDYLNWSDLLSASLVCKEWHTAVRQSKAWRKSTQFAITQNRWSDFVEVVDPSVVNNLSGCYQNLIVRGFAVDEWCQLQFEQMCSTFVTMVQQCDIRGFTLTVPVGSRFLREFMLSNEDHLQTVEDFTLNVQNAFCDSHTYNFIVNFGALRRIRFLQAPLIDLHSTQAIQVNSSHLEEIIVCSNASLAMIFNISKAELKRLRICAHSYHERMIQKVISIRKFMLDTLVIECLSVKLWIDYIATDLLPVLEPRRLVINQRQMIKQRQIDDISNLFKSKGTRLCELKYTYTKKMFCECGNKI